MTIQDTNYVQRNFEVVQKLSNFFPTFDLNFVNFYFAFSRLLEEHGNC